MSTRVTPLLPLPAERAGPVGRGLLLFMGACTFLNLYLVQALLPTFEHTFAATKAQVGWTVSATTLAVALVSPLAGVLVDRLDRTRVLTVSFLLIALATLGAAGAPDLPTLVAWRFAQGLFIPGAYVAALALIGETWAPEQAGLAVSTYVTGTVLGGFSGRFVAGLVATYFGWREAFVLLGLLDGLGAIAAWACLAGSRGTRAAGATIRLGSLPGLLAHRLLAPIYGVGFVMLFTLVSLFTYINYRLAAAPFGLSPAAIGCVFLVYLVGAVVTPVAGRWIDQLGFRAVGSRALLLTAVGVLLTLASSLPVVVAGLALAASGVFIGQSAATSLLGVVAGRWRAPAAGLYLSCYYFGGSVGGVLPAAAWAAGGWPACVALIALTALAAAGLMATTWPAKGLATRLQQAD